MSTSQRNRSLPAVPNDVPRSLKPLLAALRENAQVLGGQGRGNKLDSAITRRELTGSALIADISLALKRRGDFAAATPVDVTNEKVEDPTTPTGVSVVATSSLVMTFWATPTFGGYKSTLIYRKVWPIIGDGLDPVTPTLDVDNDLYGETAGTFIDENVNSGTTYIYWFRHSNIDGLLSAPTEGFDATVKQALDLGDGWVTDGMLEEVLRGRIEGLESGHAGLYDLVHLAETGVLDRLTTIEALYNDPVNGIDARVGSIEAATVDFATKIELTSYVQSSDLGTTLAGYVLSSTLANADYASRSDLTAYVETNDLNTTLSSYVSATDLANADYATSTMLASYATNSRVSAVESRMTANENEAFYSVKVDAAGKVAGFGLRASPAGTTILFNAEQIGFTNGGDAPVLPFAVSNGIVYIDDARIRTIETGSITNVAVVDTVTGEIGEDTGTATLGNTAVTGTLTLKSGAIKTHYLERSFLDSLVKWDPDAEVLGGTRQWAANVNDLSEGTYYLAVNGGFGDRAPLKCSAVPASIVFTCTLNAWQGVVGPAPSFDYEIRRRNLNTGIAELLSSGSKLGTYTNIPGEPKEVYLVFTDGFNALAGTSGDDYEYWLELTNMEGDFSAAGASLSLSVSEPQTSSGGVLVTSLARDGTTYFTVSVDGATLLSGGLYLDNFGIQIADPDGKLFYEGVDLSETFAKGDFSAPSDGDAIVYDAASGQFITSPIAGGSGSDENFTTALKNKLDGVEASANNYVLPFADNSTNWNTAYAWGDHATQGYVTSAGEGLSLTGAALSVDFGTGSSQAARGNHTHAGYATSTHDHDGRYYKSGDNITVSSISFTSSRSIKSIDYREDLNTSLDHVRAIGSKGVAVGHYLADDAQTKHNFFIAEEVAVVDPKCTGVDGKSVKPNDMLAKLYAAVARLVERIEELERK